MTSVCPTCGLNRIRFHWDVPYVRIFGHVIDRAEWECQDCGQRGIYQFVDGLQQMICLAPRPTGESATTVEAAPSGTELSASARPTAMGSN